MLKATHSASESTPAARHIVLGITGGIAAYKCAELVRLLTKTGHTVDVILTEAAEHFITPTTLQALSGRPVWTSQWDSRAVPGRKANAMAHIELSREADLILVAPATADMLAKLAHGLADDLLSTTCLARDRHRTRLAVAPAMNREMWDNPATQRNVRQLLSDSVLILGPEGGEQACGETGLGRMREPADLATDIAALFAPQVLVGARVLVTAGPTFEAIDPVRGITNRSSGKMGYEIAAAAKAAGAHVTLVSGPTALSRPAVDAFMQIESASQLFEAVQSKITEIDLFFSVAAVADYTPAKIATQKIKKSAEGMKL
jgi:phosphopantothenoylcysteine decarboxylase / phosphopantothenate---cysteine ligase